MGQERRTAWTCQEPGCGVRVRWADGEARPMPKGWKDGRCKSCVKRAEPVQDEDDRTSPFDGGPARTRTKRPKTGGRKKNPEPPPLTDGQRARALGLMATGAANGAIAQEIGTVNPLVAALRNAERIEHPNVIRRQVAAAEARQFVAAHPGLTVEQTMTRSGLSRGIVLRAVAEAKRASKVA